jgi:hypothetical protein
VKIRGAAANIAEKYQQLARDAHTSGDLVAAEAYHQYAEHYYRLVAAGAIPRVSQTPSVSLLGVLPELLAQRALRETENAKAEQP